MDFIQDVLPNIKDVSERAGIVNKYAPQMEQAMEKLETDLENQEHKLIQKSKPLAKKVIQAQREEEEKEEDSEEDEDDDNEDEETDTPPEPVKKASKHKQ